MYRDRYGTDWRTLDADEAIERMFALGVAAGLGEALPEERRRVLAQADSAYDRSVFELSYQEGEQKARAMAPDIGDEAAWTELVDDAVGGDLSAPTHRVGSDSPEGVPAAVERASFLDLGRDDLAQLRLPKLLRRED